MADYSELLGRAIAAATSGAERHEIYSRARTALVQRLREARTSPKDITRERLSLEEAIRKLETAAAERLRESSSE